MIQNWHFNKSKWNKDRETGIKRESERNAKRKDKVKERAEQHERKTRHREQHGSKERNYYEESGWIRDLTEEGVEPNPGPNYCQECDLARTASGLLQEECIHHSHKLRMTTTEEKGEEKKEAKTGAEKRILEKYTEKCKRGVTCTSTTHFHFAEDTGPEATVRLGNPNHKSLCVVPNELKMTREGLIDWTCLMDLERKHFTGNGFDLHQNAHEKGEMHHKCSKCIRFVVRLSGAHYQKRDERPCYSCLGLNPPEWYVLSREWTSTIKTTHLDNTESDDESEYQDHRSPIPKNLEWDIPVENIPVNLPQPIIKKGESSKKPVVEEVPAAVSKKAQPSKEDSETLEVVNNTPALETEKPKTTKPAVQVVPVVAPVNVQPNVDEGEKLEVETTTPALGAAKPNPPKVVACKLAGNDDQGEPIPPVEEPDHDDNEEEDFYEAKENPQLEQPTEAQETGKPTHTTSAPDDENDLFLVLARAFLGSGLFSILLMFYNPMFRRAPQCIKNFIKLPYITNFLDNPRYKQVRLLLIKFHKTSRLSRLLMFYCSGFYTLGSFILLHAGSMVFMVISFLIFLVGTIWIVPLASYKFIFTPGESAPEPVLVFTIKDDKPTLPDFYRWYYTTLQLIVPICAVWYCFDIGVWPMICVVLTEAVVPIMGSTLSTVFGFAVFQAENVLALLYGLIIWKMYKFVHSCFIVKKKHMLFDHHVLAVEPRPKKASFNKVEYEMDIKSDQVFQVYAFRSDILGLEYDYYSAKVAERKISGTLFYDEGAADSGRLGDSEFLSSVQKMSEKAGHIKWDRKYMAENKVLVNTTKLLLDYHAHVKENDAVNPLSKHSWEIFGESPLRPWWTKGIGNIIMTILTVIIFAGSIAYLGMHTITILQALFFILSEAFVFFSAAIMGMVAFVSNLGLPGAHAFTVPMAGLDTYHHGELALGTYGYRVYDTITGRYVNEEFLPMKTNDINPNKNLHFELDIRSVDSRAIERQVMGALSPFAIPGIAMPKVDLKCPLTYWCGIIHRGAGMTPDPDEELLKRKADYALEMIEALVPAATEDEIMTVDEALDTTSYPQARKDEIRDMEDHAYEFDETATNVTAPFGKDEPYSEPGKHERTIQGGHALLWAKGLFGSLSRHVKTMEHVFYECFPSNIKMMSPANQIRNLLGLGPGSKTVNDFSSYEASFSRLVQESAQFVAYGFFFQNTSYHEKVPNFARRVLGGKTTMKNKHGHATIENLKCSGAPDTSFSNWFDNVCTLAHIFWEKYGVHWTDCLDWIICEGDDNITDDHGFELTNDDFTPYGLTAKIENNLDLGEAGFCQRFVNIETGNLSMDPIRYLGRVQYIPVEYIGSKKNKKLMMLKAKAMSTLAFCPDGPVVSEHAWKILELTKNLGVSKKAIRKMARYGQNVEDFTNFRKPVITESDRLMVAQVFGFSIEQQKQVTETLDCWTGGPLHLPPSWFPDTWSEFYDEYSTSTTKESTYTGWGNDTFFDYFTERVGEVCK